MAAAAPLEAEARAPCGSDGGEAAAAPGEAAAAAAAPAMAATAPLESVEPATE